MSVSGVDYKRVIAYYERVNNASKGASNNLSETTHD